MITWLKKNYFRLQLKWLIIKKQTLLFDKINQLDWYKNTLHEWVDDQSILANSKVLEVGCATGSLAAYIASLGHIPTGADFSSKMIETAKTKNKGIEFIVADVLDLPFETDSYDVVLATSLVNIVSDKRKALSELARTCKKGGMVSILVPSDQFSDTDLLSLLSTLGNTGFSAAALEAWHQNPPKMNTDELISLFEQVGLAQIKTKFYLQGMVISVSGLKKY